MGLKETHGEDEGFPRQRFYWMNLEYLLLYYNRHKYYRLFVYGLWNTLQLSNHPENLSMCAHPVSQNLTFHYDDVIMGAMASQITSLMIVYSTVYSGADQRKKTKLRITGLCARNSPGTGEFPAPMASNAETVSIWRRHHVFRGIRCFTKWTTLRNSYNASHWSPVAWYLTR